MEFTCQREELAEALSIVERAAATREALSILSGVLVEAGDDRLRIVGTDLDLAVEAFVPARVGRPGSAVLEARYFGQIVRKAPTGELEVRREEGSSVVRVGSGRVEYELLSRWAEEFPALPAEAADGWRVPQALLKQMIRLTAFAAAEDEARPVMTGVLLEAEGNELRLVATDTYRLAHGRSTVAAAPAEPLRAVVPARTLHELARALGAEGDAWVSLREGQITFRLERLRVVSKLLEGQFPRYEHVLPKAQPVRVEVAREPFLEALERVSLLARRGPAVTLLAVGEGSVSLSAREAEVGQAREEVDATVEGEPMEAAYQVRYLTEVLRALESEKVALGLTPGEKPAAIRPADDEAAGDGYVCLVMPVQYKAG